jgi:uncharacterized membrane protein
MFPEPLHPAIVHLPIALSLLLPALVLAALLAIRTKWLPARSWSVIVLLSGLLVVGSWVALETGEHDEERVEQIVAETAIEAHEEAAEVFMVIGMVLFVIAGIGLRTGRIGDWARIGSLILSLSVLAAGARVGHLGGELVYVHGAANAHLDQASIPPSHESEGRQDEDHD